MIFNQKFNISKKNHRLKQFYYFCKNIFMKRFSLLFICISLTICLLAQSSPITTVTLKNGMNVVMCEDHSQPKIYGAVCVHVGSKNDPADNTGMAHYLEHLMFKGTDKIGTLNWEKERTYLDNITQLYDELHGITDPAQRESILLRINKLSNEATQYAIPNEVDVILDKMGGEGINAFTSMDVTCYHNCFPTNQLEKWLTVYTERFRHPVFRLFQSELEAVYEEYNMYHDNPIMVFMEDALELAADGHPYGRPTIGYQEHLKNPQISAMQQFFNTYYHPCNMTLVLVGDFNSKDIQSLLDKTIGNLHNEAPGVDKDLAYRTERMNTNLNQKIAVSGQKVINLKETPVKMGVLGFQTVAANHPDALYLDILGRLLNNSSSTGLVDQLNNENKLLMAYSFNYSMVEDGLFAFFYAPKIIGQSHEQAEALLLGALDSLKNGHFSDVLFNAVKMEYLTDYLSGMESMEDKFDEILGMVIDQQDMVFYEKKETLIRQLTKQNLMETARRYFTDDCLMIRSSMGFKKMEKLDKPNWSPVVAQNTDRQSDFAQKIAAMPVKELTAQDKNIADKVQVTEINSGFRLYSSDNPVNNIFTLNISYNYGYNSDKRLPNAISYFNLQGTNNHSFDEFQLKLQQIGASMEVFCTADQTILSISGFDNELKEILFLCQEKLLKPGNDESKLATLIDEEASAQKMQKKDASAWGTALFHYALYGQFSPEIHKMTLKELKKVSGEELLDAFKQATSLDGHVTYVGNHDAKEVADLLQRTLIREPAKKSSESKIKKETTRGLPALRTYDKPTILLVSNKQFIQSNIYFYLQAKPVVGLSPRTVCLAYNEYMSGSMAGVIFQEIRELRSLGYSAYGGYSYDWLNRRQGMVWGYLGTQADKTVEGCEEMTKLLTRFPEKPEKFENAKEAAMRKLETSTVHFRDLPSKVWQWTEQGYKGDPTAEQLQLLRSITFDDVNKFYKVSTEGSNMVITIAGDKKRMDLKALGEKFEIIEVKPGDIMK